MLVAAFVAACVSDSTSSSGDAGASDAGVSDGGTGDDGGSNDGAPNGCEAGESTCGGACVDLQTSAANCGGCGKACRAGAACIGGRCGDEIVEVASSDTSGCAVRVDGKVVCWGANDDSELGVDPQAGDPSCNGVKCKGPTLHPSLSDVAHVALGERFGCAIKKTDQSVVCWGANGSGQLAALPGTIPHSATPVPIVLPAKAKSLSLGTATACALTTTGEVYCWGNNVTGLAGKADATTASGSNNLAANDMVTSPNKLVFPAADVTAMAISTGDYAHGCAIRNNGSVWCWGGNYVFELGEWDVSGAGCNLCETTPIDISVVEPAQGKQPNKGFGGAIAIAVSNGASCAITSANDDVYCWGNANADRSQVQPSANDFNGCSPEALKQTGLPAKALVEIQMGNYPVLARDAQANVWAWGTNVYGDQGDGTSTAPRLTPTSIANLAGMTQLSTAGGSSGGAALKKDGTVVTWGKNDHGQLGHMPASGPDIVDCGGGVACNPTPTALAMP